MQFALRRVPGVQCAHARFQVKSATVVCDGSCDRDALIHALESAGYGAVIRQN